jgi:hypothetical protein
LPSKCSLVETKKKEKEKEKEKKERSRWEMEGYLWKKGERGLVRGWKKRWFWLGKKSSSSSSNNNNNKLYYSLSSASNGDADSAINFILLNEQTSISEDTEVYHQGKGKCSFRIRCSYTHRVYHLEAPSPEELQCWLFSLLELVRLIRKEKESRDLSSLQLPTRVVKHKNHPVLDVVGSCFFFFFFFFFFLLPLSFLF